MARFRPSSVDQQALGGIPWDKVAAAIKTGAGAVKTGVTTGAQTTYAYTASPWARGTIKSGIKSGLSQIDPETWQQIAQTGTQAVMAWRQNQQTGEMEMVPTTYAPPPPPPPEPEPDNTGAILLAAGLAVVLLGGALALRRSR